MKLQKLGGYAAIASLCAYIVGAVYAIFIQPNGFFGDPAKAMAVISASPGEFYAIYLLFMVCSILGFIMFTALHERMHAKATYFSHMMLIAASASTVIWVTEDIFRIVSIGMIITPQDLSTYRPFYVIAEGLHQAGGHALGWGWLFSGCAILVTRSFSRVLGWISLVTGIILIPHFFLMQIEFTFTIPIFYLTYFSATIWIGIALIRQKQPLQTVIEMDDAV